MMTTGPEWNRVLKTREKPNNPENHENCEKLNIREFGGTEVFRKNLLHRILIGFGTTLEHAETT